MPHMPPRCGRWPGVWSGSCAGAGYRAIAGVTGSAQETTGAATRAFTCQGRHGSLGCPWPNGAHASRGRGRVVVEPGPTPAPWRSAPSPAGGKVPLPETTPRRRRRIRLLWVHSFRWHGTFVLEPRDMLQDAEVRLMPHAPFPGMHVESDVPAGTAAAGQSPADAAAPFRGAGRPGRG
jgi:hypothetical protein